MESKPNIVMLHKREDNKQERVRELHRQPKAKLHEPVQHNPTRPYHPDNPHGLILTLQTAVVGNRGAQIHKKEVVSIVDTEKSRH